MCDHSWQTCGTLLTKRNGLATYCSIIASPHSIHGPTSSSRIPRSTPSWSTTKHSKPKSSISNGRYSRWYSKDTQWLEGMETSRSYFDSQSLEKQNGKRHQKTIRKCRSLHHVGPVDWSGYRCDWLLAFRQLLVTGARGANRYSSLTKVETPAGSSPYKCGQRFSNFFAIFGKSGKRLAFG